MTYQQIKQYIVGILKPWFPNKDVLDALSEDTNGNLLYKEKPISSNTSLGNVPIGTILMFMGYNIPNDFVYCDGTVYDINDYPELSEYILNELGAYNYFGGDGMTTFAVPNLQHEYYKYIIRVGQKMLPTEIKPNFITSKDEYLLVGSDNKIFNARG